jgi:hypothetical protein
MRPALRGALLASLLAFLSLTEPQIGLALEEVTVSTTGPSIFFLPGEVPRQRGFFREQNLDIKYLVTRTEADRARAGERQNRLHYQAGSTLLGLPLYWRFIFSRRLHHFIDDIQDRCAVNRRDYHRSLPIKFSIGIDEQVILAAAQKL